jgi:hypothetical protein
MDNNNDEHLRIVFSQDFSLDETNEIIESFSKVLPTKESKIGLDSAEAVDEVIAIIIFFIVKPIAEGFLKSIGSDLYKKAKEKIIKSLTKKENPKIFFQFKSVSENTDIVIKSQTNDKEELNIIFDTIDKARELALRELKKEEGYNIITVNYDNGWNLESENN